MREKDFTLKGLQKYAFLAYELQDNTKAGIY